MAGDFEIEPTLQNVCINAIADKIHVYIDKYAKKSVVASSSQNSEPECGISGSVMAETSSDDAMECDSPCLTALELDSKVKGGFRNVGKTGASKIILENFASLETRCHHDPACGTKRQTSPRNSPQKLQSNVFFPKPMSEDILKAVCKKGRLDNKAASFFSEPERFRIRRAYIKKAGHITSNGLKNLLSGHVLTEIHAAEINEVRANSPLTVNPERKRITVADVVSSMNTATKEKLKILNISGIPSEKEDLMPLAIYVSGGQFKKLSVLANVRSLNVSYTNFTDNDLNTVIACMRHLESLDISKTYVRSILYLGDMHAPKLKSLSMSNLDRLTMPKETLFDVFCKMSDLHHLDVSTESKPTLYYPQALAATSDQNSVNTAIEMVMMGGGHPLPKLVSLDISGREGIGEVPFLNFYASHSQLIFLGLLHTSLDALSCFVDEKHPSFNPNVKVTGDRTEAQITESLSRYYRRPFFAKEALFSLFNHTQLVPQYNKHQLELVLRCMRNHRKESEISYSVQLAATACVYNLTNRETGLRIPAGMLTKVVSETLATMERFEDKKQLQKNCLMTLCSDRILKEVVLERFSWSGWMKSRFPLQEIQLLRALCRIHKTFNYFKTAQLVMQCLCSNEDGVMHRMAVAIISILAAKITTEETAVLGSSKHMKVLLRIVEKKVNANTFDLTLKFTLSALWNLTDESPSTCENFIDNGGLGLFMRILVIHDENPCLQTKVLGLLNNLAEVSTLRHHLLEHDITLLESVQKLLHSPHIEVSYFAAGIISHLAILDSADWNTMTTLEDCREDLLNVLYSCVLSWEPPSGEMVAYRTFKPFFPLLERDDSPAMQLWAAWAVRHVCLKNGEKYQEMLIYEQGIECLLKVRANPKLDANVKNLIQLTLKFIQKSNPGLEILQGM